MDVGVLPTLGATDVDVLGGRQFVAQATDVDVFDGWQFVTRVRHARVSPAGKNHDIRLHRHPSNRWESMDLPVEER